MLPDDLIPPPWIDSDGRRVRVLAPSDDGRLLASALELMGEATPESAALGASVCGAAEVLSEIFASGRGEGPIEHDVIAGGSDIILDAVKDASIHAWVDMVRRFDDNVHQHCLLVAGLVAGLARFLRFPAADCQFLTQAALLHDVGKAKIPSAILNKPGALTPEERVIINTHPALGHEMLLDQGFSDEILTIVRSHHEFLDGSGYPDGLRHADIPDMVRLVTICDIFGALIERRSYKPPLSTEKALSILQDMSEKIDKALLGAFRTYLDWAAAPKLAA